VIADTTLHMDLLRGSEPAEREVRRLESEGVLLWVPTPAVFELWEGVKRADRPEEERRIDAVLGGYTVVAFERPHAARAGRVSGALLRRGTMLDPVDAQIAGMALEERLPVLTRNAKHFERVPDLKVTTY
jgi:predicted nucleic acid-binding protein